MLPLLHHVVHGKHIGPAWAAERPRQYRHGHHILACLIRGSGRYQCGPDDRMVRAPYLSVYIAGERDGNGLVGPYESFWCAFDWDGLCADASGRVALEVPDGRLLRPRLRPLAARELRTTLGLLRRVQDCARRPEHPARLRAGACLLEFLALWAEPPALEDHHVSRAAQVYRGLLEQHAFDASLAIEDLAARAGYSAEHLSVLFRRELGMTPVGYREALRIGRAKELLANSVLPIAEIARLAGYPDANYFARVFRQHTGQSPRHFAQNARR